MSMVHWFEIPAVQFERAVAFYSAVFEMKLAGDVCPMTGQLYALFPDHSGCVMQSSSDLQPGMHGSRIYLDGTERMEAMLERVITAGGKVLMPLTALGDGNGDIALIEDTEGNQIGLHRESKSKKS